MTEAREAALAELVPPAIMTLRAHIESGAPDAWKASVRVLELAFAKTDNVEEIRLPTDPAEIKAMDWTHMRLLAMQLTAPYARRRERRRRRRVDRFDAVASERANTVVLDLIEDDRSTPFYWP